jgi:AcrR family transcriptional regulator
VQAPLRTSRTPRKQARNASLTQLRRSEIIAAALKVFALKGFHNTRAEDVATQAKIAKGTLYLYFKSKDAIYEAALQHAIEQLGDLVDQRMGAAGTVKERIRVFIHARLEFWGEQGQLYRMILTVGREKQHRRKTEKILRAAVESFAAILEEAIRSGQLPNRPLPPIGWAVMDMIRGANERAIDGASELSTADVTELITGMVLRYFA